MRARNIKPSIFKNELLAVADPLYTLIFEGLWCFADREGRLEDRPVKIHMEINPGRAFEGTERALEWLTQNGFIDRYTAGQARYIQVINFTKHQNPHQKEAPSKIPEPGASTRQAPDKTGIGTGVARLIPDSGFLNPESPSLIPDSPHSVCVAREKTENVPRETEGEVNQRVMGIKAIYPRAAREDWTTAEKIMRQLVMSGAATWEEIEAGVSRYRDHCRATRRITSNPARFFGDVDRPWSQEWPIPEDGPLRRKTKFTQAMEALERA